MKALALAILAQIREALCDGLARVADANLAAVQFDALDAIDQELLVRAQNPELKSFLEKIRPAVAAHLQLGVVALVQRHQGRPEVLAHVADQGGTVEAFAGLEYEGCCYALRVLGRHYVRNREGEKNNALYVELELKGLGSAGRDARGVLRRGILGYYRDDLYLVPPPDVRSGGDDLAPDPY